MSGLTTHVLDVAAGVPARGVRIELYALDKATPQLLTTMLTNEDGRCPQPLLDAASMKPGRYLLSFHVADYFRARGLELPEPPFIDEVQIHFGIAATDQHYHVPLLVSPWSYSTYRGS